MSTMKDVGEPYASLMLARMASGRHGASAASDVDPPVGAVDGACDQQRCVQDGGTGVSSRADRVTRTVPEPARLRTAEGLTQILHQQEQVHGVGRASLE